MDRQLNNIDESIKTTIMNFDNINYLKESLKYNGFGDKLYAELEKNIQQGFPEFVLKMQPEFNGQKLDAILFFKKSDQSDLYFFNKYDAVLKNDIGTYEQSFYLNKGHGVTLKEAFNLLEGRAVYKEMSNKEGDKYKAWIELDFKQKENGNFRLKQYHENYGFDLEATLKNYPIKELQNEEQKQRLLLSLQKGNRQAVTMSVDGRDQLFFLQANPQFKTLSIYDRGAVRSLSFEQKNELMIEPKEGRTKVNGQQVSVSEGSNGKQIENTPPSEKVGNENSEKKTLAEGSGTEERPSKENKKESVKNLIARKQTNGRGKGLRA